MTDRLLGTFPDQILEREKMRLLQCLADQRCEIYRIRAAASQFNSEDAIEWMKQLIRLKEEENELDRRYPDLLPEGWKVED